MLKGFFVSAGLVTPAYKVHLEIDQSKFPGDIKSVTWHLPAAYFVKDRVTVSEATKNFGVSIDAWKSFGISADVELKSGEKVRMKLVNLLGGTVKTLALALVVVFVAGCANPNLVGLRGNKLNTDYSLQDRRMAKMHIKVVQALPSNAENMGDFSVERCHQYAQDEAPSDAVLADDLVLLAYAEGADGLTNIRYQRESGLLKNCWFVAKGTATFFRDKK